MKLDQAGPCNVGMSVGFSIVPTETKVKSRLQYDHKMTAIHDSRINTSPGISTLTGN